MNEQAAKCPGGRTEVQHRSRQHVVPNSAEAPIQCRYGCSTDGPTCESGIAVVDRSHIGDSGSPNCRTQRDHVCVRAAPTHAHYTRTQVNPPPPHTHTRPLLLRHTRAHTLARACAAATGVTAGLRCHSISGTMWSQINQRTIAHSVPRTASVLRMVLCPVGLLQHC